MKTLTLFAGCLMLAAAPASAAELVTNGGFETGNYAGWTRSGSVRFDFVSDGSTPHSGIYAAAFGASGRTSSLTQMLNTVVGTTYRISLWARNDGGTPNFGSVSFGGNVLGSMTNAPKSSYTNYVYSAVATAATTDLAFSFRQDRTYWYLDDVSVTGDEGVAPVPEPATWGMMLLGFGLVGAAARRGRKTLAAAA